MENILYDVVIIGAGSTGTSIARELSKYKLKIALIDKANDVAMGATKANSAIVHGGFAEAHEKLKGRLCYQGRIQFAELDRQLHFGFDPIGSLVLAFNEEEKLTLQKLLENGLKNGLPDLEIIDRARILELEPNVNPSVQYALYCAGAGICSPYEYAIALAENAITNGVELFLNSCVSSIIKENNSYTMYTALTQSKNTKVTSEEKIFKTKYVINASGVDASKIAGFIGDISFSIKPRSGEYLLMVKGSGALIKQVLFQLPSAMGKGVLVTPTYHGNLLIGPDAINLDSVDLASHADRLIKIYQSALRLTPQLNIKQFIRSFTGLRAVSSTDDFIIEEGQRGFINVAGIQSPGLTASPAIAHMVVDLLKKNSGLSMEPKANFIKERAPIISRAKKIRPFKEVEELTQLASSPEKIICRCEQVTQAEIIDALSRNIPVRTIDGVKRRTRAGMGFCQGNFCRPRVHALMEEFLHMPIDEGFDTEHSGISRAGKQEIIAMLEASLAAK